MKAILFDWDGTLIDTAEHVYEANVEVIKSIGLPPLSRELYGQHYSPNWRLMYAALGIPTDLIEGAAGLWHAAYKGHEAELLPGARPALERLVAAGIPIGVVTAGDRKVVAGQLKRTGVADLLGAVVYGDDIAEQKPDPEPLRRGSPHSVTPAHQARRPTSATRLMMCAWRAPPASARSVCSRPSSTPTASFMKPTRTSMPNRSRRGLTATSSRKRARITASRQGSARRR